MRIFKTKKYSIQPDIGDEDTTKLTVFYKQLQYRWANWMSHRTATFNKRQWFSALIVFVLISGGYSGLVMVRGFRETGKAVEIKTITRANIKSSEKPVRKDSNSSSEYKNVVAFQHYMDSLYSDETGKKIYDSIILKRPGLMDSIKEIQDRKQFKNR